MLSPHLPHSFSHKWEDTIHTIFPVIFVFFFLLQSVQSLSHVRLCDLIDCSTPGFPVLHCLLELAQTHVHWVSDATQPSHPLSSPSLSAFNLSQHQSLFHESALHIRWPKYQSFSLSICPSHEYSGLISFRFDLFDLLAVQGTLKKLHHGSKASVLPCSAFCMVQLSHPYMTTGKTIALTICTFVGKVMSLLFKMLSMFVIAFLPRNKCLLISWLQSLYAVILEPKKIMSVTVSIVFALSGCKSQIYWGIIYIQ